MAPTAHINPALISDGRKMQLVTKEENSHKNSAVMTILGVCFHPFCAKKICQGGVTDETLTL